MVGGQQSARSLQHLAELFRLADKARVLRRPRPRGDAHAARARRARRGVNAPRIRLVEATAFERPVGFRFPFRFGAARVTQAPQAFLRVRIEDAAGRSATAGPPS